MQFRFKSITERAKDGVLNEEWRHQYGQKVWPGEVIPMLGERATAYNVDVQTLEGLQTIGVVVGHKKFGKNGWECWAPVAPFFIKSGFGSRSQAAEFLYTLAKATGAIEGEVGLK